MMLLKHGESHDDPPLGAFRMSCPMASVEVEIEKCSADYCGRKKWEEITKIADLSPIHFRKQAATDGTKLDINIGDTRVWRL